jgi:hypothetical protein
VTFLRRVLVAAIVAVLVIAVITTLVLRIRGGGSMREEAVTVAKGEEAAPMPEPSSPPAKEAGVAEVVATPEVVPAPQAQPEPLIEELLAESGEDPGAVYYMSRVREAIREGNPAFARELLRQMKEEHSSSVLVEEAEALFVSRR